jgi:hypothetical protein
MNRILDASRRFYLAAQRLVSLGWDRARVWLSVPINLCIALLGFVFVVSFASWAIGDPFEEALLYFPDANGHLQGEVREVPHCWGTEARAELIASEVLLGPKTASLVPDFEPGLLVRSVLYRKGGLIVDISPEAALEPDSLRRGMVAMERSLKAALPGLRHFTLTIGGYEPYAVGLKAEGSTKKTGK